MNNFMDSFLFGLEKIAVEGGMTLPVNPVKSRHRTRFQRAVDFAKDKIDTGYKKLPQDWKNAAGFGAVYADMKYKQKVPAHIRAKIGRIGEKLNTMYKQGSDKADETVYAPSRKRDLPIDTLKHLGYSAAGGLAGALLTGGKRGGLALGALGGEVFSRLRNRKRMKRRLQEQGLDDKTVKKLEDRGMFDSRPMDVVPIYGRMMAAKDIRQGLQDSGKRSRGHGFGVFTDPYKSA